MAILNIISYSAGWNLNAKVGILKFQTESNGWSAPNYIQNPYEFGVIIDLLRNEKPIYYNTETNLIMTNSELVGEAE